tara:strand:+ start:202 stop:987 length:786 start_codon:yes stop_codon:yes gene_type:complete
VALLLPGFSLAMASGSVWSQSVTYGPLATAIPSLGGMALVLLSAMMFFALWQMKKRGLIDGSRFMALALVSGALASGVSGVKLVADVNAQGGAASVSLDNPAGDTEPLNPGPNCVRNVTSVVQEIRDIDYGLLFSNAGGDGNLDCYESQQTQGGDLADDCAIGTRLQPTLACFVWAGSSLQGGNNGGQASDLRLKADIVRVGATANGLPLYEFRYLNDDTRYRGVMAQDVLRHTPEAVVTMDNGYMAVRYDLLGLEMSVVQ